MSYESDGSAILDLEDTDFSLKFSAAELDVSGKPIKDFLGYESHQLVADSIAGNPVFSSGAKIYQVNFIVMNDTYQLSNWFDCDEGVVHGRRWQLQRRLGRGRWASGVHLRGTALPGRRPAGRQLVQRRRWHRDPAHGGRWRSHHGQDRSRRTPVVSFHPGAWQYRTVHGEQIIMMTLPERFTPRLWDQWPADPRGSWRPCAPRNLHACRHARDVR